MKCIINDNALLPAAIAIEHGSVADYYVQDYVTIELIKEDSIKAEVHFMEFLFELTTFINLLWSKNISEYESEMLVSGEKFDAIVNQGKVGLLLYDISINVQRRYFVTAGELIQLHRRMKRLFIDSLRVNGIKFADLKQRDLISLVDQD